MNCRALVKDLTVVEQKQRTEIDGHGMQVSQLTNKVMLLETSKAQLYTQLGALKVGTAAAATTAAATAAAAATYTTIFARTLTHIHTYTHIHTHR